MNRKRKICSLLLFLSLLPVLSALMARIIGAVTGCTPYNAAYQPCGVTELVSSLMYGFSFIVITGPIFLVVTLYWIYSEWAFKRKTEH